MNARDIAAQMLSTPAPLTDGNRPKGYARGLARSILKEFAGTIADYPERFVAFAAIPTSRPDEPLDEIACTADELKLDGNLPVFVHPTNNPHIACVERGA